MIETEMFKNAQNWLDKAIDYETNKQMTEKARAQATKAALNRACDYELLAHGLPAKFTLMGAMYNANRGKGPAIGPPQANFVPKIVDHIPENTIVVQRPTAAA